MMLEDYGEEKDISGPDWMCIEVMVFLPRYRGMALSMNVDSTLSSLSALLFFGFVYFWRHVRRDSPSNAYEKTAHSFRPLHSALRTS
jgi:hypothetical protein